MPGDSVRPVVRLPQTTTEIAMQPQRTSKPAILVTILAPLALLVTGCQPAEEARAPSAVTAYDGARVIIGNGEVIETATFTVADGRFVGVGATGNVDVPAGATRVDLTGQTVMPTIVDAHVHMSTTRDALIQDLQQRAAQGVGAAMTLGSDGLDAPLEIRNEIIPGAARYSTAGRGITMPEPGRSDVPHWVTSEDEARQAVRDEAAREVDIIKIWVDDRNGQYEKLTPELYSAIIDEAHQHDLRVTAHIFALEDAKGLLRAGIDAFAHGVRDRDIDDEFVRLVLERPNVVLVPNLPQRGVPTDIGWLRETLSAEAFAAIEASNIARPEAAEAYGIQARNLKRLSDAGMTIAFGTDGNTFWAPHVEMEDMVAAGMSPGQVIVAATRNAAALAGFPNLGTIDPGMSADFIVLDANPLEEITNTRRIADVYLRGDAIDRRP